MSRFLKFAMVGGFGALVQLSSLKLYRFLFPDFHFLFMSDYLTAVLLSIETAIISNFILNNAWTFKDRKLKTNEIIRKFSQFNLASMGSLVVQMVVAFLGENLIGLFVVLTVPYIGYRLDTGTIYAVIGIGLGLFWNFFAYNYFIWNKKS